MTTSYWNPGMNPFRTLPKDAPARVKEQPRAAPSGPYNDRGGYSGGFRGRGGFSGGRGGMNQTNFNQNRNFNNNMGFNSNMGGGGGFNGPMGGGNFGFNGGRGGMMGGGMRGGPGGMRGGRGGNMMGMGPMGGMPMGMPGNMGMMGMGGGMPGKDAVECIHKALLTSSRLPRHEPQLQRRRLWLQPESRWRWKRRLGQSARSQAPTARMNDLVATLESFRNAITNGADVGEGCTFQTAASCIIGRDGRGHYEFGAQSVCGLHWGRISLPVLRNRRRVVCSRFWSASGARRCDMRSRRGDCVGPCHCRSACCSNTETIRARCARGFDVNLVIVILL